MQSARLRGSGNRRLQMPVVRDGGELADVESVSILVSFRRPQYLNRGGDRRQNEEGSDASED